MNRNIDRPDGIYYCVNNGFSSSLGIICDECYHLTNFGGLYLYINIRDKNGVFLGTHKLSSWQNFDDYFITQAEWREQQIKSVLDE